MLFLYNFEAANIGFTQGKNELVFQSSTALTALGTSSSQIVFTSYSSARTSPQAGDWSGIEFYPGQYAELRMRYCTVQFSVRGIWEYFSWADVISLAHCNFNNMSSGGVVLWRNPPLDGDIDTCYFSDCGPYGIAVTYDQDCYRPLNLVANEIANCSYGIYYQGGRITRPPTKGIITENNKICRKFTAPNTYGIYIIKYVSSTYPPDIQLFGDSINSFQDGINLQSVASTSTLENVKSINNSSRGLALFNSSPNINGSFSLPNKFNSNLIGIQCDQTSNPVVVWSRIKENTSCGVLIDSHDGQVGVPNFGQGSNGENSFSGQLMGYYDMRNNSTMALVPAVGNYWGEYTPKSYQIVGPIDYSGYLTTDPLPGMGKLDPLIQALPYSFELRQNYPNPFNPTTKISFYLNKDDQVSIRIYNINGQLVKTLTSDYYLEGEHTVTWDGRNSQNKDVTSGVYFYVLASSEGKASKSMTLLR